MSNRREGQLPSFLKEVPDRSHENLSNFIAEVKKQISINAVAISEEFLININKLKSCLDDPYIIDLAQTKLRENVDMQQLLSRIKNPERSQAAKEEARKEAYDLLINTVIELDLNDERKQRAR